MQKFSVNFFWNFELKFGITHLKSDFLFHKVPLVFWFDEQLIFKAQFLMHNFVVHFWVLPMNYIRVFFHHMTEGHIENVCYYGVIKIAPQQNLLWIFKVEQNFFDFLKYFLHVGNFSKNFCTIPYVLFIPIFHF